MRVGLRELRGLIFTVSLRGVLLKDRVLHIAPLRLEAKGGPANGDYYGMTWPCWGTAEMAHPGTPNLYDPSKPVADGGLCFRARFGVERNGDNLLAEGSYPVGSEIQDGYPEFTMQMLMDLGWDGDLTADERASIEKVAGAPDKVGGINWKTDLSGGIQEWLSFYFKSPVTPEGLQAEHDLFIQQKKLKNTLRWMMGEELITHLGREYYDDE